MDSSNSLALRRIAQMVTKFLTDQRAAMRRSEVTTGADLLIVIPTLNEAEHIERVLAALQEDRRCSDALIVVADGGSSDDTVAIVERIAAGDPRVHVLPSNERLTTSASINSAVEHFGQGRALVVMLDPHARFPERDACRLGAHAVH